MIFFIIACIFWLLFSVVFLVKQYREHHVSEKPKRIEWTAITDLCPLFLDQCTGDKCMLSYTCKVAREMKAKRGE